MSDVFDRIRDEIGKNDVLLFMKGTPVFPQCGFSAAVVEVLSELGVKFHGVNILVDPELRQGIKEFSQWPTIPQLYVKGEFIGGCDIIRLIKEGIPGAEVEIQDLAGDGDHWAATVVSPAFAGKSKIQQHQMVYGALGGRMGGVLHALKLTTMAQRP